MAVGDIYQVTLKGTIKEQAIVNVFHYRQQLGFLPGSGNEADDVVDGFIDQKIPDLLPVSTSDVVYDRVQVDNLFDETQQVFRIISEVGSYAVSGGNSIGSHPALGYRLEHGVGGIKQGAKRIAGVPSGVAADGVVIDAGFLAEADTLATALEGPITVGLVIQDPVFIPVIVKRVREGATSPYTYRLPANSGELVYAPIVNALLNLLLTTQNSRKIGIGE